MIQRTIAPDYSKRTNDELCELALGQDSLTEDAKELLKTELRLRKIDANQVALYWDRKNRYADLDEQKKQQHKRTFWENAKQMLISLLIACVIVGIAVPVLGFSQNQANYLAGHVTWITLIVHFTRRSVWRWPSDWWPHHREKGDGQ